MVEDFARTIPKETILTDAAQNVRKRAQACLEVLEAMWSILSDLSKQRQLSAFQFYFLI